MTLLALEQPIATFADLERLGVQIDYVPEAAAIDYDRTLGDPYLALERLYNVARDHDIDPVALQEEALRTEQDGGTYEPLTAVQKQLGQLGLDMPLHELARKYVDCPAPSLLYPDAADFIRRLDSTPDDEPYPHAIATTGPSEVWQMSFKLAAAGCGLSAAYLSTDCKVAHHESLKSPDGTYDYGMYDSSGVLTGVVRAATLKAVDDKPRCLAGGDGYLLRRTEPLPSQAGDWPPGKIVSSLDELVIQDGRMIRRPSPPISRAQPATLPKPRRVYHPIRYQV